jgi:hypothetical protein
MNAAGVWLGLTAMSAFLLVAVFLTGAFASGKDLDETCAAAGQELDLNYRLQNLHEPSQFFPLRNKCNAAYDTVPDRVNPALAVLALLTAVFLIATASALFSRVKSRL